MNYLRRPLIVGNRIIIAPRAGDLYTGKIEVRAHPVTGSAVPGKFLWREDTREIFRDQFWRARRSHG